MPMPPKLSYGCHGSISAINVAEVYGICFLTEAFENKLHPVLSPTGCSPNRIWTAVLKLNERYSQQKYYKK